MTGAEGGEPGRSPRERTGRGGTGDRRVPRAGRRGDDAEASLVARRVLNASRRAREADPKAAERKPSRPAADIGIRPLKELVLSAFPEDHPLRTVILAEKDDLPPSEFLAKLNVWLVLLNRRA